MRAPLRRPARIASASIPSVIFFPSRLLASVPAAQMLPTEQVFRAVSLSALEEYEHASHVILEIEERKALDSESPRMQAILAPEIGRVLQRIVDRERSKAYYSNALHHFASDPSEVAHYARAMANLGFLGLEGLELEEQQKAVELVDESSHSKASVGDLEGLSTNYCQLGTYYWGQHRYQAALAYMRRPDR
jgi:hypothetical protein